MKGSVGITLGDPAGIGPEVALKALAEMPADDWEYSLIGDSRHVLTLTKELGISFEGRNVRLVNCGPSIPSDLKPGNPVAAEAAMAALTLGGNGCLTEQFHAIVTAPVNKEAIIRLGKPFTGQTEFLSDLADTDRTAMMLLGHDDRNRWLRVALATTHIPIREVSDKLTQARIELAIELAAAACRDLGLPRQRVAVSGLNPHAGEGGEIGTEEITVVAPAVEQARKRGVEVEGPIPADTLFYYAFNGHYDAVVAMYHDQGLAPLKMIAFENGINWTLGLPFIRTSPDHGTAYNIAGQNKANPGSMVAALNLARQLAQAKLHSSNSLSK